MAPEFECRRELEVLGSPEEVWRALATTDGNAAWLYPQTIDPQQATSFDPQQATSFDPQQATSFDPPHHLAVRSEQGAWFNAIEWVIEARDGGRSFLRYAHGGIFVDDWDNQYDAVQQHTDFYMHTLGQYLQHFSGRTATYIGKPPAGIPGPASSA